MMELQVIAGHFIAIYGANEGGRRLWNSLTPEQRELVVCFVDNKNIATWLGKPVLSFNGLKDFFKDKQPSILLIASSPPTDCTPAFSHFSQVISAVAFARLLQAMQNRWVCEQLLGMVEARSIACKQLKSAYAFLDTPAIDRIEAFLTLLSCIHMPLSIWRESIRTLLSLNLLTANDWLLFYRILQVLQLSKIQYLVFKLAHRYAPNSEIIGQLHIQSMSGLMDYYAHRKDTLRIKRWAEKTLSNALAFHKKWISNYATHKCTAIAAQELQSFERSILILNEACQRQRESLVNTDYAFLSPALFTRIGSTMHVETLVKSQQLGWSPIKNLVCLFQNERWGNDHLVNAYLSKFIEFMHQDEASTELLEMADRADAYIELIVQQRDKARFVPAATIAARTAWQSQKRPPFLVLSQEDKFYGDNFIANITGHKSQPFVTIHLRHEDSDETAFRNTSITNVLAAIEWLVEQHITVIRIGNAGMPELPPMPGVIDVATQFANDSRLNVYLMASCHFFIGSGSSGPIVVPSAFGVPVLSLNTLPLGAACGTAQDTFLPTMALNTVTRGIAGWQKTLSRETSLAHFLHQWDELQLRPIENTSADILEAVQFHSAKVGLCNRKKFTPHSLPPKTIAQQYRALINYPSDNLTEPLQAEIPLFYMIRYRHLLPKGT